jgi:uncharacterized protein YggE
MIECVEYSFSMKSFVLTVSLLLLTSAELIKINGSDYSSVKVSGHGDTYDTPDIAKFSLTVRELRNTSKEAADATNEKIAKLLDILVSNGVKKEEFKTTRITISPRYDYKNGEQVFRGQEASESIEVKLKNINPDGLAIGKLIDDLATVDNIDLSGVSFDLADKTESRRKARAEAFADAKKKAQQFADLSELKLGKVETLEENTSNYAAPLSFVYSGPPQAGSSQTQVPVGQYQTFSDISITFRML